MSQDLKFALRSLAQKPAFSIAVVLILAIGIGLTTTMVAFFDRLLIRPPAHIVQPENLYHARQVVNYPQFREVSRRSTTLLVAGTYRSELTLGHGIDGVPTRVECVTPEYFELLGPPAFIGTTFNTREDSDSALRLAMLQFDFWQRQFGGDTSVVGRTIQLSGAPYRVVGVAPRDFHGADPDRLADAWVLLPSAPDVCAFGRLESDTGAWLFTIARVKPGVSLAQAEQELAAIRPVRLGDRADDKLQLQVLYDREATSKGREGRLARWLSAGALLVFVIACLNVAGLTLIRTTERRREIAVRLQLGASRLQVVRQSMLESMLPAMVAVLPAALIALWSGTLLAQQLPNEALDQSLHARSIVVMIALATLAVALSGVVPAISAARTHSDHLRVSSHLAATRDRGLGRKLMLATQIAVALALITSAALFVQSIEKVRSNAGFDIDRTVVITGELERLGYTKADAQLLFEQLHARVRELPDVERVSLSYGAVLGSGSMIMRSNPRIDGKSPSTRAVAAYSVDEDYFAVMGTRLLRGRAFSAVDTQGSTPVVIVNEALAAKVSALRVPNRDVLGECVTLGKVACVVVVGVAENRRFSSLLRVQDEYYVPALQASLYGGEPVRNTLLIKPRTTTEAALSAIAAAVRTTAPNVPALKVLPLADLADRQTTSWRTGATLFGLFGSVAVILAAVGIYAVLALWTRQRTAEIGVRIAVGADRSRIVRLVLSQALVIAAVGWIIGAALTYAATRAIASLLFEVQPGDIPSFMTASAVILSATCLGALIPALRAARLQPSLALRQE